MHAALSGILAFAAFGCSNITSKDATAFSDNGSASRTALGEYLLAHPNVRGVALGDWGHGSAVPVMSLKLALPDLLKWGLTSLITEDWDTSYDCVNAYLVADPSRNLNLEDFCDRGRYTGKFRAEQIYALPAPGEEPTKRHVEHQEAYRILQRWNHSHEEKVLVRPLDGAMRDYKVFVDKTKIETRLPSVPPEMRRPDQPDLKGTPLSSVLEQMMIELVNPDGNSRNRSRFSAVYLMFATLYTRAIEDAYNIKRFEIPRFQDKKFLIFYGSAHTARVATPFEYNGRKVSFLVRQLKDMLGEDKVISLWAVGKDETRGTDPVYGSRFEAELAQSSDGLYGWNSVPPADASDYPAVCSQFSYLKFLYEDVDRAPVGTCEPDMADFYWVHSSFSR